MEETLDFDAIKAEQKQIDVLIDSGIKFTVPKRSVFAYFSKSKTRTFEIKQPYLGTLDYLSNEYIKMEFSEERIKLDPLNESKRLSLENAKRCARVVAIAVLNSKLKILLFTRILSHYFLWRITPKKLFELALIINTLANTADFTNSIRWMSVSRTTAPNLIETPDQEV